MGVVTLAAIDYGKTFGPLPQRGSDVISHIGMTTKQERDAGSVLRIDPNQHATDTSWLYHVTAAGNEEEQNMEAYMKGGHVYYRCLRIVREMEELFVWYSKDLALVIGITDIPRQNLVDKPEFVCPGCGEIFSQPFPFRAHIRFKCNTNYDVTSSQLDTSYTNYNVTATQSNTSTQAVTNITGNSSGDISKRKRNLSDDTNNNNNNVDSSLCASPSKKLCNDTDVNDDVVDLDDNQKDETVLDMNDNLSTDTESPTYSAFKKVAKSLLKENITVGKLGEKDSYSGLSTNDSYSPTIPQIDNSRPLQQYYQYPTSNPFTSPMPILPMLSSLGMQRFMQYMSRETGVPDAVRVNHKETLITLDRDVFQKAIHLSQTASLSSARNISKLPVAIDKSNFPFIKTSNPMVDKLLHSLSPTVAHVPLTSIPMTQNWCAQCNATFRMTSDLVYHMRSHHQREFDPIKKKREDKLRCGVCHEGFRERHHLTRHMTSHL